MQQKPIIKLDKTSSETQKLTKQLVKDKTFINDFNNAIDKTITDTIAYENKTYGKAFGVDFVSTIQIDTDVLESAFGHFSVVVSALVEVSIRDTVKNPLADVLLIDDTPELFHDLIVPNAFTYVKVISFIARLDDDGKYIRLDDPLHC